MGERIVGIDISYCQKGLNFKKVKEAGVKFALIRAGYWNKKDNVCDANVKGCESIGIDYGFYWYSYANSVEEARMEAQKCVEVIRAYNPTYPIYFDMEDVSQMSAPNRKLHTDMALEFCRIVSAAGYVAGVYANPNWLENYYEKARLLGAGYELWLACWTYDPNVPTKYNYGQRMWQWGITKIGGMSVDGNITYYDYASANSPAAVEKSVETLADEVIAGKWGNGKDRYERLTAAGYDYNAVQTCVNEKLAAEAKQSKKTVDELAIEVLNGKWGNGAERRTNLSNAGYSYSDVQDRVNEILAGKRNSKEKKSLDEVARAVIAGDYGNYPERKERLEDEGYNYREVQSRVNEMLRNLK